MSDPVEMDLKPRNVASEYLKALARIKELEAENERLLAKIKGPSSWPCGLCGTPKVLDCPVCSKARIEAALAWDLRGETAELTEGEMLDLMVKALKGEGA